MAYTLEKLQIGTIVFLKISLRDKSTHPSRDGRVDEGQRVYVGSEREEGALAYLNLQIASEWPIMG